MSKTYTIGLGEPQPEGKLALFKPSMEREEKQDKISHPSAKAGQGTRRRIRTTIELSALALGIIQEMQNRHRLETGRVLPLWRLVSEAIEGLGQTTKAPGI
jgi:hypothetical protein